MAMQLLIIAGPEKGQVFPLTVGDTLLVGRSRATATKLTDPHVSRVHCQVEFDGERATVADFESAGGTFVNGQRITKQQLEPGDIIQVGGTELRLQSDAEQATVRRSDTVVGKSGETVAAPLNNLVGQTLAHYAIESVIAKGQAAVVFRAQDTKDNRTVALKVLEPEFSKDEDEKQRFVRAMKTMLPLRHPNLVTLYGAGKTGPYCWAAMEFVEGESLTQVIQRIGVAGMLDWRYSLRVAIHIARALDYAGQRQIIHRNVAPPNILVRSEDKLAKLGDLMLAKALEGTLAIQITRRGELVGDVAYMSPERTRGTTDVDARSDIYSLGATLYALLTGRPPFEADSLPETITKIRQAEPEKLKKFQLSIPDMFEGTVLQMLAKRPDDRYQSATQLLTDLERVAKLNGVVV